MSKIKQTTAWRLCNLMLRREIDNTFKSLILQSTIGLVISLVVKDELIAHKSIQSLMDQNASSFQTYEFIVELTTHWNNSRIEGLLYLPSVAKPHGRSDVT